MLAQNTKFGLQNKEVEIIQNYLKTIPELSKVVIFGSRARGDFKEFSDIDLCLFSKAKLDVFTIKNELNQLRIPFLFDVLQWENLDNLKLKNKIEVEGKPFWEK
jgi:predicted nucleotidyltransferase